MGLAGHLVAGNTGGEETVFPYLFAKYSLTHSQGGTVFPTYLQGGQYSLTYLQGGNRITLHIRKEEQYSLTHLHGGTVFRYTFARGNSLHLHICKRNSISLHICMGDGCCSRIPLHTH